MTKLDMLQSLVSKTTDKVELDKLNAEILKEIRDEEKAKLEKKLADDAAEAEKQAAIAKSNMARPVHSGIEVGLPDLYKGRRFKLEMDAVQKRTKSDTLKDPKAAEIMTRSWLDALANARENPGINKAVLGQSESAAVGGYAVGPEYPSVYFNYAYEKSRALQICDNISMSSNVMYIPSENAKVSLAITAEGTDAPATSAVFNQVTLTAKRFDASMAVTNELLADQNVAILPILLDQLTEAVGQKVDSCVFSGTGDPMSSVFSAAAGYSVVLGTGSSTFASITAFSSFLEVVSKLPTARHANARWASHRSPLWAYIYAVRDAASRPLFLNNVDSAGVDGAAGKILGYPVTQLETGPATTAVSTSPIVFGDFKGVKIGHRLDTIDLFIDPYSAAKSYQTQVYLFTRWAFSLALPNNFVRLVTSAS